MKKEKKMDQESNVKPGNNNDNTMAGEKPTEIEELQAKYDEINDKYLRLYSDFDNYKRRTTKERIELYKSAGEDVIISLLPVIDDFERAVKSNEESDNIKVFKEGIKLVYNKLKVTLEQKGLENMDSMKKKFDTDMHEAITNIPAPSRKLRGKVVDVIEKGYLLNGKVIRFAKVVVGN